MENVHTLKLLDATLPRITRAEERGLITGTIRSVLTDYFDAMRAAIEAHELERERISRDESLSVIGRREAAGRAFERTEQIVNAQAQKVAAQTENAIAKAQRKATPPPPETPADVLEAQLGNARTDARMVLDPLADNELHTGLASLAQDGGPAMRHLILATDWPGMYLRSRNSRAAEAAWANQRPALLPIVLDEKGTAAAQTLAAAPDLRQVAEIARHSAHLWAREAKMRGGMPAGGAA